MRWSVGVVALLGTVGAAHAAPVSAEPGAGAPGSDVDVAIGPAQPSYLIGEPVWIEATFENHGESTFRAGVSPYVRLARGPLLVEVTGPDGAPVPDPFYVRPSGIAMNGNRTVSVEPGRAGSLSVDLNRYAWLDVPGTYDVRLLWSWPANDEPPPRDDPRWYEFQVRMVEPTEAEARTVVEAIPRSWERQGTSPNYYEGLGHARYVPILEELARDSEPRPEPVEDLWFDGSPSPPTGPDERALYGIGACPCPESTAALLRLYDALPHPELRAIVSELLLVRVPEELPWPADHPLLGAWTIRIRWFRERAWSPRFEPELRRVAHAALSAPTEGDRWHEPYELGATVLRRIGTADDLPVLVDALERVLSVSPPQQGRVDPAYTALSHLQGTLGRFDLTGVTGASPDGRRILALLGWNGAGEPPAGWLAVLEDALSSANPRVLEAALRRVPETGAASLRGQVRERFPSRDRRVVQGALGYARRYPDPGFLEPTLDLLRTGDPALLGSAWMAAGASGAPLSDRMRIAIERMGPGAPNQDLHRLLATVLTGCRSWGAGPIGDEELPGLKAAWNGFVDTHHAALDAGARWPVDGPAMSPELFPSTFRCTLDDGGTWP